MPSEVMFGLLLVGVLWLLLLLVWIVSAERRASQAAFRAVQLLDNELAVRRRAMDEHKSAVDHAAEAYVTATRRMARLTFPLEDLREFGAKNVRWTALREASVRNLEDVARAGRFELTAIPGVGGASVERLVAAAEAAIASIDSAPIPLPEAGQFSSTGLTLVASVARARTSRLSVMPLMETIEARRKPVSERAITLRRRAGFAQWVLGWRSRRAPGGLLEESRSLEVAAKDLLSSEDLGKLDSALHAMDSSWNAAAAGDSAALAQGAAEAQSSLQGELREALAAYRVAPTPIVSAAPTVKPPPATPQPAPQRDHQRLRVARSEPARTVTNRWIPPGQGIEIQGYRILSGMIYVGGSNPSDLDRRLDYSAVIDPSLPVDHQSPDREGKGMTYWPAYDLIQPAGRAAYLEWLATGRRAPDAYIGYIFLFFYGLERRLFHDALTDPKAEAEAEAIIAEVKRLLEIYGENGSFHGYATGFLDIARARQVATTTPEGGGPPQLKGSDELPLALRVGLGKFVADGRPVPSDWALAWLRADPSTHLRLPAERCPSEFDALFRARFEGKFGEGLRLSSRSKAIVVRYRAASSAFEGPVEVSIPGLPDVTGLTSPVQKLQTLAEECTDALAAYSRWRGKHPEGAAEPAAAALLPPELASMVRGERIDALTGWAERTLSGQSVGVGASGELIRLWGGTAGQRLAKGDAVLLAQFFEKRGYGIEPDVRFGSDALAAEGSVVVFRHDGTPLSSPSAAYSAAATLLRLGSLLAGSDTALSEDERRFLERRLESSLGLATTEQIRLRAHLRWLQQGGVGLAGIAKRVEALANEHDLAKVGEFLVGVAAADGRIEPGEVKTLLRLFPMLGLAEEAVYSALHRFGMPDAGAPTAPVTVKPASSRPSGYAIPAAPASGMAPIVLDPERVRLKLAESDAVFGLLKDIFTADEPPPPPTVTVEPGLWGLDGTHSAFLRELAKRPSWSRADFETAAARQSLLPDGAIEAINDAAFETHDNSFIDGDDPLELHLDLLKEESA